MLEQNSKNLFDNTKKARYAKAHTRNDREIMHRKHHHETEGRSRILASTKSSQGLVYGFMVLVEIAVLGELLKFTSERNIYESELTYGIYFVFLLSVLLLIVLIAMYVTQTYAAHEVALLEEQGRLNRKETKRYHRLYETEMIAKKILLYGSLALLLLNGIAIIMAAVLIGQAEPELYPYNDFYYTW